MTFDTYKSCYGCPNRAPGCHGRCQGYQYRVKENEKRNQERRDKIAWVDDGVFEKRLGRLYNEKYRRKR